jgi:putative salt-induced outer membrane protein YdiY
MLVPFLFLVHPMRHILLSLLLTGLCMAGSAQVVNTETKRILNGKDGWNGHVDFGFSLTENTRTILQGSSQVVAQYQHRRNSLLLINDLRLMKVNQAEILNRGYQHVRFSHEVKPFLIPEAFTQVQYDQVWLLDMRFLAGAGPRFRIFRNDTARAYGGALVMYEFEKVDGGKDYNRDFRLSAYLSGAYQWSDRLGVDHITYFQPRIWVPQDFRISTETNVRVGISRHLGLKVGFNLNYDARPPVGLPTRIYTLTNSISYVF